MWVLAIKRSQTDGQAAKTIVLWVQAFVAIYTPSQAVSHLLVPFSKACSNTPISFSQAVSNIHVSFPQTQLRPYQSWCGITSSLDNYGQPQDSCRALGQIRKIPIDNTKTHYVYVLKESIGFCIYDNLRQRVHGFHLLILATCNPLHMTTRQLTIGPELF